MGVPLDELPVVGALDQEVSDKGLVLRRLPAWTRPQVTDPAHQLVVAMPAGVRLELAGGPAWLELTAMLTAIKIGELPYRMPSFDLVVDGELLATVTPEEHSLIHAPESTRGSLAVIPGPPAVVRFELPEDPSAVIEIWFPHAARVEIHEVRVPEGCRLERPRRDRRRWIHHGSSISHCIESLSPTQTWPALVAQQADLDLLNLGFGGQCMLDPHVARTIRDLDADVISITAGINILNADSMRERTFRTALHGFLDTIREGHPDTPLLLASPIICPAAENHPGPSVLLDGNQFGVVPRTPELSVGSLTLQRIRKIMAEIVEVRRDSGDQALHYLDGLSLLGESDVDQLVDGLHPGPDGYRLMAARFHALAFAAGPLA